jgi:hypothetical protein
MRIVGVGSVFESTPAAVWHHDNIMRELSVTERHNVIAQHYEDRPEKPVPLRDSALMAALDPMTPEQLADAELERIMLYGS